MTEPRTFHAIILERLLEYRHNSPDFKFLLRQRSGPKKRYESGHWFPGREDYASVGLVNASAGNKSTKSISLLFKPIEELFNCRLAIQFKEEKDTELIDVYRELAGDLEGIKQENETHYAKEIGNIPRDNFEVLYEVLDHFYPTMVSTFKERGMNSILVSQKKFDKLLHRVQNFQQQLANPQSTTLEKDDYEIDFPLNTIFYGPPGTGKTYHSIKRAAEIVSEEEIDDYQEALDIFRRHKGTQIEFITFHQNFSYEDFIQGLRPVTEESAQLLFKKVDGIFKSLVDRALTNWEETGKSIQPKRNFSEVFQSFIQPLEEGEVEEIEVPMKRLSYAITNVTSTSIEFRKNSGGTEHTLSISTLEQMYHNGAVGNIQGLASYYRPLLEQLLKLGRKEEPTEEVEKKNFVLIIDEINRANISRVFGELITLLEPDKRRGGAIELSATLPSGDNFCIPNNLYLIGTMNTADKSIALLDIALRRRFVFEAMYPLYEIEGQTIHDADILKVINQEIIKRKGHDFQIGHSYFMEDLELADRMNKKVIPLLLEYFMNDKKEVTEILEVAGFSINPEAWPLEVSLYE